MRVRHWILAFVVVLVCGLPDAQVTCQGGTQFSQKLAATNGGLYSLFVEEREKLEELPDDPYFVPFKPIKAPVTEGLLLKKGDRLAICGDSITEQVAFADVFLSMLVAGFDARQKYGADYMISGKDGVHPGWAGQLVMAQAFLEAMGLDGDIGTINIDLSSGAAEASAGHRVLSANRNEVQLESEKYPFCATGEPDKDSSIRSGMALVSFNEQLNRFMLVARNGAAQRYRVTWGEAAKSYTAAELTKGINLADDFHVNPFSEAFNSVDEAVLKKQIYETKQIKRLFHGEEGKVDMDMTVALTEKAREPLAKAIKAAFKPVRHTIRIEAETAGR